MRTLTREGVDEAVGLSEQGLGLVPRASFRRAHYLGDAALFRLIRWERFGRTLPRSGTIMD